MQALPMCYRSRPMLADSSRRRLYAIFFLAGIPALVYQVTWQRAFGLYFGVDVYSATMTVATFMAGLGFGALVGGVLADRTRRPILLYATIELTLGACGALSPWLIASVGGRVAGASLPTIAVATGALMLVPTFLMGATMPVMSRIAVQSDAAVGARLSILYGINTLGAGCGALLTSYLLLGLLGLDGSAWLAAALNVGLAVLVITTARQERAEAKAVVAVDAPSTSTNPIVFVLAFGSGLVSLGYEIVWYRLLGVILHGTVYVFGTILAVFLLGIGWGSLHARRHVDGPAPLLRFAMAQVGISAYVLLFTTILGYGSGLPGVKHVLSASFFTTFHPSPLIREQPFSLLNIYSLADIPMWSIAMLGVPTFLMGFGFPHLLAAATAGSRGVSAAIGRVYAANIVGSILGTLLVGFVLLGTVGCERTLQLLTAIGALLGAVAAWRALTDNARLRRIAVTAGVAVAISTVLLAPGPGELLRATHLADFPVVQFQVREDTSGVVALRRQDQVIAFSEESKILGVSKLHIDGAAHGRGDDGSGREWSTAIALVAAPAGARVLSIGLGDGVMCDSVLADPTVEELVIVELNGELLELLRSTPRGSLIASSPKVRYINDDGRRWLNANPNEKFDFIMTFPLHPAHAGYGNLFSLEFFALVARHLEPDGAFFARSTDPFSTARTLAEAFPFVLRLDQSGYVAKTRPFELSRSRLPVATETFLTQVEADRDTILLHTQEAPLNRDFRPRSEFYLTYPWAGYLMATKQVYIEPDKARFLELLRD